MTTTTMIMKEATMTRMLRTIGDRAMLKFTDLSSLLQLTVIRQCSNSSKWFGGLRGAIIRRSALFYPIPDQKHFCRQLIAWNLFSSPFSLSVGQQQLFWHSISSIGGIRKYPLISPRDLGQKNIVAEFEPGEDFFRLSFLLAWGKIAWIVVSAVDWKVCKRSLCVFLVNVWL